ncbi:hypothetical protein WDW86_01795 [Bdellovibrionota bacterium FG-2]
MVLAKDEAGQATVEYILLLSVIVTFFILLAQGISQMGLAEKLARPIQKEFKAAYRYGHPKAKGEEEGGYEHHPRAREGGKDKENFRIFLNPKEI